MVRRIVTTTSADDAPPSLSVSQSKKKHHNLHETRNGGKTAEGKSASGTTSSVPLTRRSDSENKSRSSRGSQKSSPTIKSFADPPILAPESFEFPEHLTQLYHHSLRFHKQYVEKNNLLQVQSRHIHAKDELLIRLMKREEFERRRVSKYLDKLNHAFPSMVKDMKDFIAHRIHNDNEIRVAALLMDRIQEMWNVKMQAPSNSGAAVGPTRTIDTTVDTQTVDSKSSPSSVSSGSATPTSDENSSFFLSESTQAIKNSHTNSSTSEEKRSEIPSPRSYFNRISNATASETVALLQEGLQIETSTKLKEYISQQVSHVLSEYTSADMLQITQNPGILITTQQTPAERHEVDAFESHTRAQWWEMLDMWTMRENNVDDWILDFEASKPKIEADPDPHSVANLIVDVSSDEENEPFKVSLTRTTQKKKRAELSAQQISAPNLSSPASKRSILHDENRSPPPTVSQVKLTQTVSCQTDVMPLKDTKKSTKSLKTRTVVNSSNSNLFSSSRFPPTSEIKDPKRTEFRPPATTVASTDSGNFTPKAHDQKRPHAPNINIDLSPSSPVSSPQLRSSNEQLDFDSTSRIERTPLSKKRKFKKYANIRIQTDVTSFTPTMVPKVKRKKPKPVTLTCFSQTELLQTRHCSTQKNEVKAMIHNQYTQCNRDEEANVWRAPRDEDVECRRKMIKKDEEISKMRHVITLLRSKCQQLKSGTHSDMIAANGLDASLKVLNLQSIDDLDNLDFDIFSSQWQEESTNTSLDSGHVDPSQFLGASTEERDGTINFSSPVDESQLFVTSPPEGSAARRRASWVPSSSPLLHEDTQPFLDSPLVETDFRDAKRSYYRQNSATLSSRPGSTVYRDSHAHSTRKRISMPRRSSQTPDSTSSLIKSDYDSVRYKVKSSATIRPESNTQKKGLTSRVASHRRRNIVSASSSQSSRRSPVRKRSKSVMDFPPTTL